MTAPLYSIRRVSEAVEIDFAARRRKRGHSRHRARLLDFKSHVQRSGSKTVGITGEECMCGRNHYMVLLKNGEEVLFCPVVFWLNMCELVRQRDGDEEMIKWSVEHPLGQYIKRIDEEKDATYEADD
jgi:hypothetical protein